MWQQFGTSCSECGSRGSPGECLEQDGNRMHLCLQEMYLAESVAFVSLTAFWAMMYVFSPLAHCILKSPQAIRVFPEVGSPTHPQPHSKDNWLWTTWPSAHNGFLNLLLPLVCTQDSSSVGSVEIKPLANYEAGEQNRRVFKGSAAMGWRVNVKPAPCAFHSRLILPQCRMLRRAFLTPEPWGHFN